MLTGSILSDRPDFGSLSESGISYNSIALQVPDVSKLLLSLFSTLGVGSDLNPSFAMFTAGDFFGSQFSLMTLSDIWGGL